MEKYIQRLSGVAKSYAYSYLDFKTKKKMESLQPNIRDFGLRELQAKLIRSRIDALLSRID